MKSNKVLSFLMLLASSFATITFLQWLNVKVIKNISYTVWMYGFCYALIGYISSKNRLNVLWKVSASFIPLFILSIAAALLRTVNIPIVTPGYLIIGAIGYYLAYQKTRNIQYWSILSLGISLLIVAHVFYGKILMRHATQDWSDERKQLLMPIMMQAVHIKDSSDVVYDHSKYILADFWSTSCIVCIKKFNMLEQLIETGEIDKGRLSVYAISNGKENSIKEVQEFLSKRKYKQIQFIHIPNNIDTLKILGYPTEVLFDKNRIPVLILEGFAETKEDYINYIYKYIEND